MPKTDAAAATTPRSRKGAQTRARLLQAAKEVFEDTGFLEARISDIAERAGLSHGSFYHYFDSKEQIFREVAEEQEGLLTAPAEATDEPAPTDLTELERIRRANRLYRAHNNAHRAKRHQHRGQAHALEQRHREHRGHEEDQEQLEGTLVHERLRSRDYARP